MAVKVSPSLTGADVSRRVDRDSDVEPLAEGDLFVVDDHPSGSGTERIDVSDLICAVIVADRLFVPRNRLPKSLTSSPPEFQ